MVSFSNFGKDIEHPSATESSLLQVVDGTHYAAYVVNNSDLLFPDSLNIEYFG